MKQPPPDGLTHLRVTLTETAYIGPGRADLLQFIAETGSIAAAGRRMNMSYRRAWMLTKALNEGFGTLVETSRGGSEQGGARLTEAGEEVLARYRHMQDETRQAIAPDITALRALADRHNRK